MARKSRLQVANEAADIAEAEARQAVARRVKAHADVHRQLAWPIVIFYLFSGAGLITFAPTLIRFAIGLFGK